LPSVEEISKRVFHGLTGIFRANGEPFSPAVVGFLARHGGEAPGREELDSYLAATCNAQMEAAARSLLARGAAASRVTDQPRVLRRGNHAERLAFHALSRCLHRRNWNERAELLRGTKKSETPLAGAALDAERGFASIDGSRWRVVEEAIAEAAHCFDTAPRDLVNPRKVSMRTAALPKPIMGSRLMALARHEAVLRFVGDYLGGLPILLRINLLHSENDALQEGSSQFFHIDPEDFRQVKLFLLVRDVDEETGPLHLVPACVSERIQLRTGYRLARPRLSDDQVHAEGDEASVVRCTGSAGTMIFADTSRCFHMGSRPGTKKRYVAMFQYVTPAAPLFPVDAPQVPTKFRHQAEADGGRDAFTDLLFGVRR
jgi:hypothetical protein